MLGELLTQSQQMTIIDMEASVEHMSRGTVRHVDLLLIVTEPYYRSLETAGRIASLAPELGIKRFYAVANKIREQRDLAAIREYCAQRDLEVLGAIPFDEAILSADQQGRSLLDEAPESAAVAAVTALAGRIEEELWAPA